MTRLIATALAVVSGVACIGGPAPSGSTSGVGAFIDQTDGRFGYQMLRPAAWTPINAGAGQGRSYIDAQAPNDARVGLTVTNLAVAAGNSSDKQGEIAQWEAFRRDPSLEGWTAGIERTWRSLGIDYVLLERLTNAKIYLIRSADRVGLVAYVIDRNQPLALELHGSASHPSLEPLEKLQAGGLLADFMTMVKSVRAIPTDPANVSPPL